MFFLSKYGAKYVNFLLDTQYAYIAPMKKEEASALLLLSIRKISGMCITKSITMIEDGGENLAIKTSE